MQNSALPALKITNLSIRHASLNHKHGRENHTQNLFQKLSFSVAAGEVFGVMGPSGSGKSTLLMWISGLLDTAFVAKGGLEYKNCDLTRLPPENRGTGLLFQDHLLFPHLSVAGNLAFGLPARIKGRAERNKHVETALDSAQLSGFGSRDPMSLSGGQQARVALMRTLLAEPKILLLDEPFGKLDAELRASFRNFVFSEARKRNLPTILVSHDESDMIGLDNVPLQMADYCA